MGVAMACSPGQLDRPGGCRVILVVNNHARGIGQGTWPAGRGQHVGHAFAIARFVNRFFVDTADHRNLLASRRDKQHILFAAPSLTLPPEHNSL
jgi:hypothetical protein